MNILVLNGSPKGGNSGTLYTSLYLEKLHPEHSFFYLSVGQKIRFYETDFTQAKEAIERADLLIFSYPVYTFLVPYQMHRFLELMKIHAAAGGMKLAGKYATQISTSKHFYDVTAHKFVEENCHDMGLKYLPGLSADMEDLLHEKGQLEARSFFEQTMFFIEKDICTKPICKMAGTHASFKNKEDMNKCSEDTLISGTALYKASFAPVEKTTNRKISIITSCADDDVTLRNMIADFTAATSAEVKICNIRQFPFAGGCLGCLQCAISGKCIYKDGFDDYLRNEIQDCNGMVYAFTIENHYAHSCFKAFDDRQFCNGHRTVMEGTPVGYLINGNYSQEMNLRMVVEARAQVGGNFFAGVVAAEDNMSSENIAVDIKNMAMVMDQAMESHWVRPKDFYGVGGSKIFRDLIYVMRGIMKADHQFYKAHGAYNDLPQKQRGRMIAMMFAGKMLSMPSVQKKMGGKITEFMVAPYKKVIDDVANLGYNNSDINSQ